MSSNKIRRKENRESVVFKDLSETKKRLSREEWKDKRDKKRLLIWLLMKTKIRMKFKCRRSSLFKDFTLLSLRRRWNMKWKRTIILRMHSRRSEPLPIFQMLTKLFIDFWQESRHTLNFWLLFLRMKERLKTSGKTMKPGDQNFTIYKSQTRTIKKRMSLRP